VAGIGCPLTVSVTGSVAVSANRYRSLGTASFRAQPGIRSFIVNRRGRSGVTVIFTIPSQGYRVSCVSFTRRPASTSMSAVPAA
jgi:hypothetical protein